MITLRWLLYLLLTFKDRERYMMGKAKGMQCTDSHDSSKLVYGSSRTYIYDPNTKPFRTYLTRKEFYEKHEKK